MLTRNGNFDSIGLILLNQHYTLVRIIVDYKARQLREEKRKLHTSVIQKTDRLVFKWPFSGQKFCPDFKRLITILFLVQFLNGMTNLDHFIYEENLSFINY
jgi:hypothetical protein